ncbi:biopolymer transporter ExbD [Lacihabitans sp. CCS-44]|uniref:ExbD/TolR family protein n=1 Tax=Lacihabitans sp. CCS-44 TaxID=2487331 RepID=UPI0020CBD264|nr:biopolymer transporter ExbD [Lacihabitans sp. CCS-44]MCP9754821.1 biopolymer transporter ExbD [Lacihabitans sp. CCS-44]
MAEITENLANGKRTLRKNSSKPDMTPMVDLGFLLITFFMFTTTFSNPNMMKLFMPEKGDETGDVSVKNSITFILGKNDRVFWHQKDLKNLAKSDLVETDFTINGIRQQILEKLKTSSNPKNFTVIIKPSNDANFKNTVDILDEMEITNMKRYALVDLFPAEQLAYNQLNESQIMKNK